MDNSNVNAHPNLNGNSPDAFRREGRALAEIALQARQKIIDLKLESFHLRNYQHTSDPIGDREEDLERLENVLNALADLQALGVDIYLAADQVTERQC